MQSDNEIVIVINPGSTSTKYALWSRKGCVRESVVRHDPDQLVSEIIEQLDYRRTLIDEDLDKDIDQYKVVGVSGRGGLLKPLKGGTYRVNQQMLDDLKSGLTGIHASNLGAVLANHYANRFGVEAFIVDPVTVDEFEDVARISGVPWIVRKSRAHALNIKAVVRRATAKLNVELSESRFVVAHLGGGISIAAVRGCRIIDVNDAMLGMGPFSPARAGALPIGPLIERCFSGEVTEQELMKELSQKGGLEAYCGTSDAREVVERAEKGDRTAENALNAMIYQIAKEIGAMSAVLKGRLDAVVVTGGLAHAQELMTKLKPYVASLAPFVVFPGEGELQALAEGAFRTIDRIESAHEYI
ncbi:MAG: butyrate kinase [Calditrichaeota bacterium]|jgi:butyrate kinase|nr:butyrate kinase [Calditrichota bacterium]MBT7616271.1 butyrate kinase [Calditrichota bacterium]